MFDLALEQAQAAAEQEPKRPEVWYELGEVLAEQRDFLGAIEAFERGLRLAPNSAQFLSQLANATLNNGDLGRSQEILDSLARVVPGSAALALHQAQIHLRANRMQEAEEALRTTPEGERSAEWHIQLGTVLVSMKKWEPAEAALRVVSEGAGTPMQRAFAWFQWAKMREKQEDYDGAWAAATEAHRTLDRKPNADRYRRAATETKRLMDRQTRAGWARASMPADDIVLIVGMPRSGTSLLEQILSMTSTVANGGELSAAAITQRRLPLLTDSFLPWPKCIADMRPEDADALQAIYRAQIAGIAADRVRVTDKSLLLVNQLGMLSLILPGVRSIMLRRHPLDNIVSCHTTHLACLGHEYTSDLRTLAEVWRIRNELQDFWMAEMDPKPLDLHYEALVSDQEAQTRRVLDHLEVPWDPRCLEFHRSQRVARTISFDQVNQKMYTTSVERWRRYEKHLGPAIDVLGL